MFSVAHKWARRNKWWPWSINISCLRHFKTDLLTKPGLADLCNSPWGRARLSRLMCGGGYAPPKRPFQFNWGCAPNLGQSP